MGCAALALGGIITIVRGPEIKESDMAKRAKAAQVERTENGVRDALKFSGNVDITKLSEADAWTIINGQNLTDEAKALFPLKKALDKADFDKILDAYAEIKVKGLAGDVVSGDYTLMRMCSAGNDGYLIQKKDGKAYKIHQGTYELLSDIASGEKKYVLTTKTPYEDISDSSGPSGLIFLLVGGLGMKKLKGKMQEEQGISR